MGINIELNKFKIMIGMMFALFLFSACFTGCTTADNSKNDKMEDPAASATEKMDSSSNSC